MVPCLPNPAPAFARNVCGLSSTRRKLRLPLRGRDDQIGEGVLHRELGIESSRVRVADNFDAPLPATLRAGFLGKEKKKGRHR